MLTLVAVIVAATTTQTRIPFGIRLQVGCYLLLDQQKARMPRGYPVATTFFCISSKVKPLVSGYTSKTTKNCTTIMMAKNTKG